MIAYPVSLKKMKNLLLMAAVIFALAQTAAPSSAAPELSYTVNTSADPGPATCTAQACSLRAAIATANNGGAPSITITFNLTYPAVITLGSSLPAVTETLFINGPGSANLTIDGNDHRVFAVNSTAHLTLNGVTIWHGNDIFKGGGILVSHGELNINDSLITENLSSGDGGALYNDGGTVRITRTTFLENDSFHEGAISNHGALAVSDSLFQHNLSRISGAIDNAAGASLTVNNSTFTGNGSRMEPGGAILSAGTLVIANSTFENNAAGADGGDLAAGGPTHITNSTFANANPVSITSIAGSGSNIVIRNSILASGITNCSTSTMDIDASNLSSDATCASATIKTLAQLNLGPLQNNLGNTPTIAPMAGSAAIDAGNDFLCAIARGAPTYGAGGRDQRGFLRPQGPHCDVGAVEVGAELLPIFPVFLPFVRR